MAAVKKLRPGQARTLVNDIWEGEPPIETIDGWLARGDRLAFYEGRNPNDGVERICKRFTRAQAIEEVFEGKQLVATYGGGELGPVGPSTKHPFALTQGDVSADLQHAAVIRSAAIRRGASTDLAELFVRLDLDPGLVRGDINDAEGLLKAVEYHDHWGFEWALKAANGDPERAWELWSEDDAGTE